MNGVSILKLPVFIGNGNRIIVNTRVSAKKAEAEKQNAGNHREQQDSRPASITINVSACVKMNWDCIGQPEPGKSGKTPENQDHSPTQPAEYCALVFFFWGYRTTILRHTQI